MELVWGAVVAVLVWLAWEIGGTLIAEMLGALIRPVVRPLKLLLTPPYGLILLIVIWGTTALLAWLDLQTEEGAYTVAALIAASAGLIVTLMVRDGYRSARGIPSVTTRIAGKPSALQRTGFLVAGLLLGGIGALMFLTGDAEALDMWLIGAGVLVFAGYCGLAALTGRLRGPIRLLFDATVTDG